MRRTRLRFLVVLAGAWLSAGCGGKVIFDEGSGGGGSTSASTGAAKAASTSVQGATGSGGCDAASHTIDVTGYNQSCMVVADCVGVFTGNYCNGCSCPTEAINTSDLASYDAEAEKKQAGAPPSGCFCPASKLLCAGGKCAVQPP